MQRLVRISALLLLLWLPSPSEPAWRFVAGVVKDASGNALKASVVQLENEFDLSVRSYITGADGRYHFSGVSYDIDFTLKARYKKYWSNTKELSKFSSAAHPEIDLVIPID
ncbi:MAG: carboxypeptidase-like regulatory domain-containing protein [Bryobacteraceae bacterium]